MTMTSRSHSNLSSPLVGEGCEALANEVSLGEAGWGVPPRDQWERRTYRCYTVLHHFLAAIVRRHPPSQPSPTRGEGVRRSVFARRDNLTPLTPPTAHSAFPPPALHPRPAGTAARSSGAAWQAVCRSWPSRSPRHRGRGSPPCA